VDPWDIVCDDGQEVTFRARSVDVFHPLRPSSNPKRTQKGKDV